MNGNLPDVVLGPSHGGASRVVLSRTTFALLVALSAGVIALVSPPAALLVLSALGARVLLQQQLPHINLTELALASLAALSVSAVFGLAGAIGVLFAWRLLADTRWSVAEAKRLATAAGRPAETSLRELAHAWATPLFGISIVAFTAPHMIAGLPLDLPHVPFWVPVLLGAAAAGLVFDWALKRAADWRLGELAGAPAMHLAAHHVVFALGFGFMIDVSAGLVALIAWRLAHAAPFKLGEPQPSFTAVP